MSQKIVYLKELIYNGGIFFVFGAVGYAIMFIYKLFIARIYDETILGTYSLAETIFGILLVLACFGLVEGIQRFVPIYKNQSKELLNGYLKTIFFIPILISIIISIFLFIFSSQIVAFFSFPQVMEFYLHILSLILPFRVTQAITRNIFITEKKVHYTGLSEHIIEKGTILLGLLILYLYSFPAKYLIILFAASIIIASLYDIFIFLGKFKKKLFSKKHTHHYSFNEWITFSLPLFLTGFFSYIIFWTDNLTIGKLLTASDLGIYSAAYSLAAVLQFIPTLLSTIFLPVISEDYVKSKGAHIQYLFKKSASLIQFFSFPVGIILIIYSGELLEILFGQAFAVGTHALSILGIGILLSISLGYAHSILILYKKTSLIFFVNFFIAVLNIILNIILINQIGIKGAAISSSLSIGLQSILFFWLAQKHHSLNYDLKHMLKIILSGMISLTILMIITKFIENVLLKLLVAGIIYPIIYIGLLLFVFRFLQKDDVVLLEAIEKRIGIKIPRILLQLK